MIVRIVKHLPSDPSALHWEKRPAVVAWHQLRHDRPKVLGVEALAVENPETAVYRLLGVGRANADVVGKRNKISHALIERVVYEQMLPELPLVTLQYYGFVAEPHGDFAWIFLEDVGQQQYDRRSKRHRDAAGRWLGAMNTTATRPDAPLGLPARDPDHYLRLLHAARHALQTASIRSALGTDDLRVLDTLLSHCDYLSIRWDEVAAACEATPQTLVHGDFIGKNVGIRLTDKGLVILPFDWAKAGWGSPAEDVANVDIYNYWLTVRSQWTFVGIESLMRLADAGKLFRCMVFLDWIVPRLAEGPVDRAMNHVKQCETWLGAVIRESGWRV